MPAGRSALSVAVLIIGKGQPQTVDWGLDEKLDHPARSNQKQNYAALLNIDTVALVVLLTASTVAAAA